MVGNGDRPLDQAHIDDITLEEYVLGQLLPDQEAAIRQHLTECARCRNKVSAYRTLCSDLSSKLRHELDEAVPSPQMSFDRVASEWQKPRRRFNLRYRLQQVVPSASLVLVMALLVLGLVLIFPGDDTAALRRLDLADAYSGPPTVVAASTDAGLIVVQLDKDGANVVKRLGYVRDPQQLRLAPSGQWVAFEEGRTLHVLECVADGVHVRLDVSSGADWSWSPDSRMLAYTDGAGRLMVFEVATQSNRVIAPARDSAWGKPVWSTDGQQIAYAVVNPLPVSGGAIQQQSIWRANPVTGYRVEVARNPRPDQTLLTPAAWANGTANLLAWDNNAAALGGTSALYWVDVAAHHVAQLEGQSLAYGTQLAWPVSAQQVTLMTRDNQLLALDLNGQHSELLTDQIPWPQTLDWAPNGAWMAYTVAGAAGGSGLYVFALDEQALEQVSLPAGATEKTVFWAGPEHLFVMRQPEGARYSELWLVPLTTGEAAQRVMSRIHLPETNMHNGWRWGDVIATQMIAAY